MGEEAATQKEAEEARKAEVEAQTNRRQEESAVAPPGALPPDEVTAIPPGVKPDKLHLYKTSTCKRWDQGNCHFGSACHFAHGERELRKPPPKGTDPPGVLSPPVALSQQLTPAQQQQALQQQQQQQHQQQWMLQQQQLQLQRQQDEAKQQLIQQQEPQQCQQQVLQQQAQQPHQPQVIP